MPNALDEIHGIGGYSFLDGPLGVLGTQAMVFDEPRIYLFKLKYRFGRD